jgi:hypothetical protein
MAAFAPDISASCGGLKMPVYELEILEAEGGVTRDEHVSPGGASYHVHDSFEHEGRTLRVRLIEETEYTGTDQRLICAVEQAAEPH